MTDDDDWLQFNAYDSPYEQRVNRRTGQWQHRDRRLQSPGMRRLVDDADLELPWRDGRAPS